MSRVSQSRMRCQLAVVPSRPIDPVTQGRSSGSTSLPNSAFATPAPKRSATAVSSATHPRAPCPTSRATFLPELSKSAAALRASGEGIERDPDMPRLDGTCLKA
ncbi:Uncharacterised protein [Mycobacteroides abscessus subsp. abscessus]|nr:Uncharacterised protein [Mycobacteroides abscessus subsp. abscessus]